VDAAELPKADVRLREGDRVFDMDIIVLETPGHTPGSVCFYGEKEGVLFSGDTLFFDGVGRTDLPGGSEKKLRESILKKIAVLPPETRVFAGHGPFTTVEREKRGKRLLQGSSAGDTIPVRARPVAEYARGCRRKIRDPCAQEGRTSRQGSGESQGTRSSRQGSHEAKSRPHPPGQRRKPRQAQKR